MFTDHFYAASESGSSDTCEDVVVPVSRAVVGPDQSPGSHSNQASTVIGQEESDDSQVTSVESNLPLLSVFNSLGTTELPDEVRDTRVSRPEPVEHEEEPVTPEDGNTEVLDEKLPSDAAVETPLQPNLSIFDEEEPPYNDFRVNLGNAQSAAPEEPRSNTRAPDNLRVRIPDVNTTRYQGPSS